MENRTVPKIDKNTEDLRRLEARVENFEGRQIMNENEREILIKEITEVVTTKIMSGKQDKENTSSSAAKNKIEADSYTERNNKETLSKNIDEDPANRNQRDVTKTFADISRSEVRNGMETGMRRKDFVSHYRNKEAEKKNEEKNRDNLNLVFNDNQRLLTAMFAEASCKVGFYPITEKDVRFFADGNRHKTLARDTERKIL